MMILPILYVFVWTTCINPTTPLALEYASRNTLTTFANTTLPKRAQGDTRTIPVFNVGNGLEFSVDLGIGGSVFRMQVDTGSSDAWLFDETCSSDDKSCGPQSGKQTVSSARVLYTDKNTATKYTHGGMQGRVVRARNVQLGPMVIPEVHFGAAVHAEAFTYDVDGILGLGFRGTCKLCKADESGRTFLESAGISSFCLLLPVSQKTGSKGVLTIGAPDPTYYQGTMIYEPLIDASHWNFGSPVLQFGDQVIKFQKPFVLVDSGTSVITMESEAADTINRILGTTPGSLPRDLHQVDCSKMTTGPILSFYSSTGNVYSIPPSIYILRMAKGCYSGIAGRSNTVQGAILGDVFLRQYYTHFDMENKRLGFAVGR